MSDKGTGLIRAIFDTDNFFMQICEKILDLITVNLLFLLSCLPLVTIGIAKLSLYQTLFEIKGNRRVKVIRTYTRIFRENWKQGLKLGLLELALVGISLFDLLLFRTQEALPFQVLKAVCFGIIIFTILLSLCVYPLAGKFLMSFRDLLQTSLVIVSLNFPWFFVMMAVIAAILVIIYSSGFVLLLGFSLFAFIGFAGLAYLHLPILEKIFAKYSSL
ncbi:DUF624 domain-containing protein [Streptococcus sp. Marseille-P6264]|uniref:DUF624 domain-containing protein n=1 Tax=Streptococcus sp. Marseille-P6264 TaxID=2487315 RepID=UPI0011E641FB|nr:DUF624 domain-containing protein [Streptococcus sp. Marseille-P6264]